VFPPDGEMITETDAGAGCGPRAGGDGAGLLAEFRTWLDPGQGLSAESVRCYCSQAKSLVAAIGGPGAVGGLDAGMVTAFMVEHSRDRSSAAGPARAAWRRGRRAPARRHRLAGRRDRGHGQGQPDRAARPSGPGRGGACRVAGEEPPGLRVTGGVGDGAAALPAADRDGGPPGHGPCLRPGWRGAAWRAPASGLSGFTAADRPPDGDEVVAMPEQAGSVRYDGLGFGGRSLSAAAASECRSPRAASCCKSAVSPPVHEVSRLRDQCCRARPRRSAVRRRAAS
jgi:hypothetical protein